MEKELVLFETSDKAVALRVPIENETVWLTQEQMSKLFDTARSSIAYHIGNVFREGELDKSTSVENFDRSIGNASRPPLYYNLDVIISVGYRVKSQRGVEFRRWANSVLKEYILKGYALNDHRLEQLGQMIRIMKRAAGQLDSKQVLSVMENYQAALDLLDDYDHQTISKPTGNQATYVLTYEECRKVIIYTSDQFIEDVHKAVACFEHGPVKYVTQNSCTTENTYEDIFEKEEAFSYQNEYRLLLKNVYCSSPLSIWFFNQSKMRVVDL